MCIRSHLEFDIMCALWLTSKGKRGLGGSALGPMSPLFSGRRFHSHSFLPSFAPCVIWALGQIGTTCTLTGCRRGCTGGVEFSG